MLTPAICASHPFRYSLGRATVTESRLRCTGRATWTVGLLSGLRVGLTGCEILRGAQEIPCGVHEMSPGAEAVLSSPPAAPVLPPRALSAPPKEADGYFPLLRVSGLAPVYGDGS